MSSPEVKIETEEFIVKEENNIELFPKSDSDQIKLENESENPHQLATNRSIAVSEEDIFKCEICQRSFFQMSSFKVHLSTVHLGDRRYEFIQRRLKSLRREPQPVRCDICQKLFARPDSLKGHMARLHSGKEPIKCDVCGKFLKSIVYFNEHKNVCHSVPKLLKCGMCQKCFKRNSCLHRHMNSKHAVKKRVNNVPRKILPLPLPIGFVDVSESLNNESLP